MRGFSLDEQKRLAASLARVLSLYRSITDAFIIEFFTDDLWGSLPSSWQTALADLPAPQVAVLLLEKESSVEARCGSWPACPSPAARKVTWICLRRPLQYQEQFSCRRTHRLLQLHKVPDGRPSQLVPFCLVFSSYSSVWPLSLLAFKATARALAFPRNPAGASATPEEFRENPCQNSKLPPLFRKHVKPKKQHEIQRLGEVVKKLSRLTGCYEVIDVGSGQGHLARFLAFGLQMSVTAIERDPCLVAQAVKFDRELVQGLKKGQAKQVLIPDSHAPQGPNHVVGWINPESPWSEFMHLLQLRNAGGADLAGGSSIQGAAAGHYPTTPFGSRGAEPGEGDLDICGEKDCRGNFPTSVKRSSLSPQCPQVVQPKRPLLLTGLHACGDLSVTLLRLFVACPHIVGIASVACCYMKLSTQETARGLPEPGYPLSSWVSGLPGHQLSYKAREGACHAIEDYILRLKRDSPTLKVHCFRAVLETVIRAINPAKKRCGVQAIPKVHQHTFEQYAYLGLKRVGMTPNGPLDLAPLAQQQRQVVAFFSLALLLAPLVETLLLLDRMIYLQEQGFPCELIPLFDPAFSARNLVLVATKKSLPLDLCRLASEDHVEEDPHPIWGVPN